MACSGCGRRKIIKQQPNHVLKVTNFQYTNDDFMQVTYVGETGEVVGINTGIRYGHRETNKTMLAHKDDYNDSSNENEVLFAKVGTE